MTAATAWHASNQRDLSAALARVRGALERHVARSRGGPEPAQPPPVPPSPERGSALEALAATFGLSAFEREVLVLCAGVDLEAAFGALCAAAQGAPERAYPSFGLALAALPQPHWDALSPARPLRRWRLVELGGGGPTLGALRIDEWALHHLVGVRYLDPRLAHRLEVVRPPSELVPSHEALSREIVNAWTRRGDAGLPPLVGLSGPDPFEVRSLAAAACERLGLELHALEAGALPTDASEGETLARLWEREAALSRRALLVDCFEADTPDPARERAVGRLLEGMHGRVFVAGPRRRPGGRPSVHLEVGRPSPAEQRRLWQGALGEAAGTLEPRIDELVGQFSLGPAAIEAASRDALARRPEPDADEVALAAALWDASRAQTRPRLEGLIARLPTRAGWDDLVLPEAQRASLREIVTQVRHRGLVYERWGFAKGSRGLGITALFAGASGTGKTTAAEVIADELHLDLYRIDLSSVISKYIGETEKNLGRVFDAAEEGGAVLLFDEADALFGKRSEVKDSHDRYANIEVSYLLQRMEAYRGLAVLTSNLKSALDPAFLRRLRFVVQFPFPDPAQRAVIWSRAFPADTPTEGLEPARLAQLGVSGGSIRNIALNAAFFAAAEGSPVRMVHVLRAARGEYAKQEKALTDAEVAGWT